MTETTKHEMMKRIFFTYLAFFLMVTATSGQAQTVPVPPATGTPDSAAPNQPLPGAAAAVPATLENVMKAMARIGAIDLNDDRVLDDYARAVYCDIYDRYHADEFTWRKVRAAMRTSIKLHMNEYALDFMLDRPETLAQYDFSQNVLPLASDSVMTRTIYLMLYAVSDSEMICGTQKFAAVPPSFIAILDKPLQLNGLPLDQAAASDAVKGLELKNGNRLAYGRFIVSIKSFMKIDRLKDPPQLDVGAHLNTIEFFRDPNYQSMFWNGAGVFTGVKASAATPLDQIPFEGVKQ